LTAFSLESTMPLYRRDNGRFIYALLDPRDGTVRYVGCAIDVEKRFQEHLRDRGNTPKCRWLAELKQDGLYPKLEILEIVKGFYGAFSREDYWIKEMLAAGAPLTNFIPMQGVFTKQKAAISTPYSWRGTKLRTVRKRLKVTKDKVADLAGVSTSAYNRAEGGFPVNYDVAMDILQAINSLLVEYGQSEVSIEDLDWMTE
jgi:DNA-binding XRE family transcriptional regulator